MSTYETLRTKILDGTASPDERAAFVSMADAAAKGMQSAEPEAPVSVDRIAIEQFVAHVQALVDAHNAKNGYQWKTTIGYTWGQKFIRVTAEYHGYRHVYCFVEEATGNILKADGWKRPARGVHGNIRQADLSTALTAYGAVYAR